MAVPDTHASDEEWAQERVARMMEPEEPIEPPLPGEEIAPPETKAEDETVLPSAPLVETEAEPASDDGIDEIIHEEPKTDDEPAKEPETDQVVDEIVKFEGDEALKVQDKLAENAVVMKPKLWERLKNDFSDWWDDPRKRYATIAIFIALLGAVFSFPASRAWALNTVGMRSTVSVKVLDATTNLPLKNVQVNVAGISGVSGTDGKVSLKHVRLGNQKLQVKKVAFATYTLPVYVTTSTTTPPAISLKAVGTQLVFSVSESISGLPVRGAEVSMAQANAQSDKKGKAVLTVQPTDSPALTVHVAAKGYRTETITLNPAESKPTVVRLVSSTKVVFVSKQSGKYDLYSIDSDGKNRKVLLAGTGTETQNLGLSTSPDASKVALVSTRDNQHNSQGYLLSTLTLVDTDTGAATTLEHAEDIGLLGWSGSKLVYQVTVAGASAANPNRQRIISYDYASSKRQQLASANYFNGALVVNGAAYYATSATDPGTAASFNKINADNTGKQVVSTQQIWTVLRTGYSDLSLQTQDGGWLSYTLGANAPKSGQTPDSFASRQYVDSPDGSRSLWVDSRDGKGTLLAYDTKTSKDVTITAQSSLGSVAGWLDNSTAVYEVADSKETALYAKSIQNPASQPFKITDITATAGLR